MSYGPVLNAAAVLLSCYGNVPPERSAQLIGMLTGEAVSAGWVDKAVARMSARLRAGGFDEAMAAALAAEDVLAADETPVNVLDKTPPPPRRRTTRARRTRRRRTEKAAAGAPHVLITDPGRAADAPARPGLPPQGRCRRRDPRRVRRAPDDRRLGRLPAPPVPDRRHPAVLPARHPPLPRRDELGPGGLQSWAGDIIAILAQAHRAVEDARARGDTALDQQVLDDLRERYDTAVRSGIIHNRLRDWDTGNHPGYSLGAWLRDYKEQVFLFTREFAVDWTNNVTERGAKAAKRHQAVSGYWHCLAPSPAGAASAATSTPPPPTASPHSTPSATPSTGNPWLPPLPAVN